MPGKPKTEKPQPLPKTLPACADLLYATREARLLLAKQVEAMEKLEGRLKEHLIQNCEKGASKGVSGKIGRITVDRKPIPQVKDWDKFRAYIKKTGNFDLLQKSISKSAVQELLDAKKVIPGVEIFDAVVVHCVKA